MSFHAAVMHLQHRTARCHTRLFVGCVSRVLASCSDAILLLVIQKPIDKSSVLQRVATLESKFYESRQNANNIVTLTQIAQVSVCLLLPLSPVACRVSAHSVCNHWLKQHALPSGQCGQSRCCDCSCHCSASHLREAVQVI